MKDTQLKVIAAIAALLHIPWALVLICNPQVHLDTPTSCFFWFSPQTNPVHVGIMLLAVSLWTLAAERWVTDSRWLLASFVPQQFILLLSAAASVLAVLNGHYADAYIAPRDFIFKDQWGNILISIVHLWFMAGLFAQTAQKGPRD